MTAMPKSKFEAAKDKLGALSVSERLLLFLCKHPNDVDPTSSYEKPTDQWTVDSALSQLEEAFPAFRKSIHGLSVLDYGCGDGFQSVAMASSGAAHVLGVEIEANRRRHAAALAQKQGVENVSFAENIEGAFDVVVSLNAMEHFVEPEQNLGEMASALNPGGKIYLSFGPLWMAPYGHHMHFFTSAPWINLLFPEKTVFRIRSLYREDGANAYAPGLNGMTVSKFHELVEGAGLKVETIAYRTSGGVQFLSKAPLIREFFVNIIDAVLVKA